MADAAAIASARAAEVFGLTPLQVVDSGLRAQHHALPRRSAGRRCRPTPPDKTTIVFTLPNEPGALFKALSVFALRGIDLTKLESRPMPGRKWEYLFYADLAAARDDLPCARALAHLAEFAPMLRILGSYPSCKPGGGPARRRHSIRDTRVTTRIQSADDRRPAARPRAPC